MNGLAFSVAFIALVIGLSFVLIAAAETVLPAWHRRWQRNRAIRQARRTAVTPWPKSNVLRLDERRGG